MDADKLNPAERTLLETLRADRNGMADLEGVRGKVLLNILREVGIEVNDLWLRTAERMASADEPERARDTTDHEALILDRQGSQFGSTDAY